MTHSQERIFSVQSAWAEGAHYTADQYAKDYARSLENPEGFWGEQARKRLDWMTPFTKVKKTSFDPVEIRWFENGTLNVTANCIDRHLATRGDKIAFLFEGDAPDNTKSLTYRALHDRVCRFANVLKNHGVSKGDRVCIYMPMVPEAGMAMLACARIGAVHCVVFGGFSPQALAGRINDCECKIVITADEGVRGGKYIPLKANADEAIKQCPCVTHVLVLKRTGGDINWIEGRDVWLDQAMAEASNECWPEEMKAEDPLFILYTSGSTGKPKGVLHTTGGYLLYAAMTHEITFDYREGDIYWCTADIGWITGHSYMIYGPLANGATTLLFEGVPSYPDASRFWQVVDKHKVTQFYTAPTAIRSLMGAGDSYVDGADLSSLRVLGTVGEPINPQVWVWYYEKVGRKRLPIVDTWWQTETGGHMITPLPGATDLKPGSATKPFLGVKPVLVDNEGGLIEGAGEGNLCIADSWPGQMRTIFGDHDRFVKTYFSTYKGYYFTGDGCRRDEDGYYWITGRVDDVLNISGHRMGTAEIESALVTHKDVAEAAVVGFTHDIKGQGIYVYVCLMAGVKGSRELQEQLRAWVRKEIGPIATPDFIHLTPGLPKTRSGKIMRRILRKIAENDFDDLGDISTLAEPDIVNVLIQTRKR